MTAREAFSMAFNEAFVMDASPSNLSGNSAKAGGANAGKAKGMGEGMAAAAKGAEKSMGPQKSLAEHKQEGCDAEKNGHPERCPYVQRMTKDFESQGMSHEEAQAKALQAHGSGTVGNTQSGQNGNAALANQQQAAQTGQTVPPQGQQPDAQQQGVQPQVQQPSPEVVEQQAQQIAENPQLIDQIPSAQLPQTENVQTEAGEIPVQTSVQKGIAENLQQQATSGNTAAEQALSELQDAVENGTITQGGETQQPTEQNGETLEEQTKPAQIISSSDGKNSREMTPEEARIIAENPERQDTLQEMVRIEAKAANAKGAEFEDLLNAYNTLKRMFYGAEQERAVSNAGGDEPVNAPSPEETRANTETPTETSEETEETTETTETPENPESSETPENPESTETPESPAEPSETPNPTEQPSETSEEETTNSGNSRPARPPAPDDDDFKIGDRKYKIGNTVYTDVSGKGLLRTMFSAFMAGLRGEGIITGWDRISGAWDNIKRSQSGENVRSGIMDAMVNLGLDNYRNQVKNNPVAQGKLDAIQEMFEKAKTPAQKMAAYNAFEKWKTQYLGESDTEESGGNFSTEMRTNMDSVHGDGGVVTSDVVIGEDGKPKETTVPHDHPLPDTNVLGKAKFDAKASIEDIDAKKEKLSNYLEGELGISSDGMTVTPSFNQTFIGVKVENAAQGKAIEKHIDDIQGALGENASAVFDPTTKTVMIALENTVKGDVTAKEIYASKEWEDAKKKMACPIVIGKDMQGKPVIADMKKLVHLLVAGETGKGKSVAMNTILTSILMGSHPDDVKMILLDPKGVEFGAYANSPHNLLPIAQTPEDSLSHVKWLEKEVENRKKFLNEANKKYGQNFKDIDDYNAYAKANGLKTIPRIVCAIDELTELTKKAGPGFTERLKSLGNIARFTGINLIVATQHPTKANIGGLKDNLPSRLAFSATNREATQAILGHGDEVDPATGKRRLGTGSIHRSGEFLFETDSGGQIHGQGANTGEDDVSSLQKFWSGEADEDEGDGSEGSDTPTLPQEHMDAINSAIQNGQKISMEAAEGFMDAFKSAFPSDWTITEETGTDGNKIWKASPPSETESSPEEPEDTNEENTDWRKSGTREEAVSTLEKVRDNAKKEAWDKFNNGEATSANKEKLRKALAKAEADFDDDMSLVDMKFPPQVEESEPEDDGGDENAETESESPEDENEDSPASTMKDAESYLAAEKERIDKALAKPTLKLRDRQKLRKERKALQERFNAAKAKYESGGTSDEILDILEPQEKPENANQENEENAQPDTDTGVDEEKRQAAERERKEKEEKLRSSVREQNFYNSPGFKATSRIEPKQVKQLQSMLPAGWEFVTDNQFQAPAKTKNGVVFIRNPQNGSYGRLVIKKDAKGRDVLPESAQIDVDTSHPDYEGFTKSEDGTMKVGPKAREVKAAKDRLTKLANTLKQVEEKVPSKDKDGNPKEDTVSRAETFSEGLKRAIDEGRLTNIPPEIVERIRNGEEVDFGEITKELERKYNNYVYGHDEAPDNMTIVANAVAQALAQIGETK